MDIFVILKIGDEVYLHSKEKLVKDANSFIVLTFNLAMSVVIHRSDRYHVHVFL